MLFTTTKSPKKGFTLIELLVVIAIIALLAAILFPVFARARERARAASCLANTKQIGLAIQMYSQDYDERLVSYSYGGGATAYGWQAALMPYMKSTQAWVCPSAIKISTNVNDSCDPRIVSTTGTGSGSYGYNYRHIGIPGSDPSFNITVDKQSAITRSAETVLFTEITSLTGSGAIIDPHTWDIADSEVCDTTTPKIWGNQFATWHFGGSNIGFADGHSKWMKKEAIQDSNKDGTKDDYYFQGNNDTGPDGIYSIATGKNLPKS